MTIQKNTGTVYTLYAMLFITLLLIAGIALYLSYSPPHGKEVLTLNGPWKFIAEDDLRYAEPEYDDSTWEDVDLTAPEGAHDDDVGLSRFVPGWTSKGHSNYSGYAWYRIKLSLDSLTKGDMALLGPPAVDDAYQIFINGILSGDGGADFSGTSPLAYSIQPRMFLLTERVRSGATGTIAFRVWMSSTSLSEGSGGIHIAPMIGRKADLEQEYDFQWAKR